MFSLNSYYKKITLHFDRISIFEKFCPTWCNFETGLCIYSTNGLNKQGRDGDRLKLLRKNHYPKIQNWIKHEPQIFEAFHQRAVNLGSMYLLKIHIVVQPHITFSRTSHLCHTTIQNCLSVSLSIKIPLLPHDGQVKFGMESVNIGQHNEHFKLTNNRAWSINPDHIITYKNNIINQE